MPFSRRLWLTAAVCTLALGLSAARGIEPKYLPPDTEIIVTVNVRQLLNSDIAKEHKDLVAQGKAMFEQHLAEKGLAKYFEKAGFDPFRDLTSVTVAGPGTKDQEAGFILVEGKFNPSKINALAAGAGEDIKGIDVAGVKAFEITPKDEKKTVYAAVVGTDKLVAAGTKSGLADAIARLKGSKSTTLKKEVTALMDKSAKAPAVSIVATGPALARVLEDAPLPNADAAVAGLQTVDGLNVQLFVEKNINFQVGVVTKDKMTAEKYAQAGNQGVLLVRAMVKKRAEEDPKAAPAVDVVNSIRVVNQENRVIVRGEVTAATLNKILENVPKNK
jgi:hypothetical protein